MVAHWSFDSSTVTHDGTNITAFGEQTGSHNASPGTGGTGGTTAPHVSAAFPLASSLVAGQFGDSLKFAGNNFLLFNNLTELMVANGAPSYTVSMWVKAETAGGAVGTSRFTLLSDWGNQTSAAAVQGTTRFPYAFGINSATQMGAQTRHQHATATNTTGTDIYARAGTTTATPVAINNGDWHMLTWSFDTSTRVISSYFDGTLVEAFTVPGTVLSVAMANSSSALGSMGIKPDAATPTFIPAGVLLDEVWVYNQLLTPEEIGNLRSFNSLVPEPTSLAVVGLGALALAARRRR